MLNQCHILNGDALREQFPDSIDGTIIIARECLVDGDVQGKDLTEVFAVRSKFLSENYGGAKEDYFAKVVPEFQKIVKIENNTEINLWFEDDLFCQVNFWFVANLLVDKKRQNSAYLVRPERHTQYGFGGLDDAELITIYNNRIPLGKLDHIASLWTSYQSGDTTQLLTVARELESVYPFILPAVQAHIDRIPTNDRNGRPIDSLITIMKELGTEEFDPIFKEFSNREPIYGFGDVQVKRLLSRIEQNSKSQS